CCRGEGSSCSDDQECCTNTLCIGGQCIACQIQLGLPPAGGGCCPPWVSRVASSGAVCGRPCFATGTPCHSDECGGVDATFICDPVRGDVCPAPTVERHIGDPCPNAEATSRFCGFTVSGALKCAGRRFECVARPNIDYCSAGSAECG